MKKYFRFLACAALLVGFAACSDDDPTPTPGPNPDPNPEQLAKPALTIASKDATSFTVSWTAVEHATSYAYTVDNGAEQTTGSTQIARTDLTPETTYTVKVKAVAAGYTDSEWATVSVTTDAVAVVEGVVEGIYQFQIGKDKNGNPVNNQVLVEKVSGNAYTLASLFGLPEFCEATYDKAAGTFTLNGMSADETGETMQFFGTFSYLFDEAGTMICGVFSYADQEDETAPGNDPWVLKVDGNGKIFQATGWLYLGVAEYNKDTDEIGEILGNGGFVSDGDKIEYVGEATASVLSMAQPRQKAPAMRFSSAVRMAQLAR